ncbi:allophanate hydrolase [Ancylobacter oerskovii]|uniref:Allophanate hydrolase n=1 Tax=Ancylobacter oerskovii TaxID=459519 RepID=A0ABW4Z2E0_9HYPH|nr:allophanate hydrolase [Ancylobacter oerskovii]MBS7545468.1 allophanate hydrolase [Ancylobacter oerskovii]
MSATIAEILQANRSGRSTPARTVAACLEAIERHADPSIFTALVGPEALGEQLAALEGRDPAGLPLYGVPFAVKDNIDVAGLPTSCACPDFAYVATRDATAVARLKRAGAIVIGKTNLDQFATGLNGTRSPYGTPRNAVRADLVPGGSSSGSGVAVAAGLVPFALGTDTAGSGRIPAGLNNIVGVKPSLGLVSTAGLVPACRTLDCISVFALTVADAMAALKAMAGPDEADPFSRPLPFGTPGACPPALRIAVPRPEDRVFLGDRQAEAAFTQAVARMAALGARIVEVAMEPFYETARLLYEGPWVAERYAAVGPFLESKPDSFNEVVRAIIEEGRRRTAVEAFRAHYRRVELAARARAALEGCDALMVPTMPTVYTVEEMLADPVRLNSNLGIYTNFVNLLDMCGIAVPSGLRPDGAPVGVTLLAGAGRDAHLAAIAAAFHASTELAMGATGRPLPALPAAMPRVAAGHHEIALFGAHLSGLPLNGELLEAGGMFLRQARTNADYKLYALPEGRVRRPGLLRVEPGGGAPVECEIWALPAEAFARFVDAIPAPLGIATIQLEDGGRVKGFALEAVAAKGARDITGFGGWRGFLAEEQRQREAAGISAAE